MRNMTIIFLRIVIESIIQVPTQPAITCSKLTKEALEQDVKIVQS